MMGCSFRIEIKRRDSNSSDQDVVASTLAHEEDHNRKLMIINVPNSLNEGEGWRNVKKQKRKKGKQDGV